MNYRIARMGRFWLRVFLPLISMGLLIFGATPSANALFTTPRYKLKLLYSAPSVRFLGQSINDKGQVAFGQGRELFLFNENGKKRKIGVIPKQELAKWYKLGDNGIASLDAKLKEIGKKLASAMVEGRNVSFDPECIPVAANGKGEFAFLIRENNEAEVQDLIVTGSNFDSNTLHVLERSFPSATESRSLFERFLFEPPKQVKRRYAGNCPLLGVISISSKGETAVLAKSLGTRGAYVVTKKFEPIQIAVEGKGESIEAVSINSHLTVAILVRERNRMKIYLAEPQ